MFVGKWHDRPAKNVRLHIIIFGEAINALQNMMKIRVLHMAKNLHETTPGLPRLHGPIFGVLLFSIFRRRFQNRVTQPRFEHEGVKVERVSFLVANCLSVCDRLHERQWTARGHGSIRSPPAFDF